MLPAGLDSEERKYIAAHEMCHRRRRDPAVKAAVFCVAALHWFNPLVWLAWACFCRDMEISCDEAVLSRAKGNIKKQYAQSLLKYAAKQNGYLITPLTFGEPSVKQRIKKVLRFRKRNAPAAAVAGTLVAAGSFIRQQEDEADMRKRKRILGLLLAGCLLAACGQAEEESGWQTVTVTPQAAEEKPQGAAGSSQMQQERGALQANGSQTDGVQGDGVTGSDSAQEGSGKKSDGAQADGPQTADAQGMEEASGKKLIEDQTFRLNLVPYGQVSFASYEPDTGTEPNADATFAVLRDGKTVYTFPAVHEGNVYSGNAFYAVEAVSFPDINQDGYDDVIIICQYVRGAGPQSGEVFSEARIYLGSAEGSFTVERKLMKDANSALSEVTVESVKGFLGIGVKTPENGAGMQAWQQAYIGQIQKDMVSEAYSGYDMIWLDGDNIPELVEIGDCEATGCRIVSFYDGEITVTQLNRLYFSYLEKESLLCNSEGNMDYYYDLVYRLTGGEMELIAQGYYGAEDNSNVQFDEAGEPIYQYEWEGKKMSKEEYERELKAVYDTERAKSYTWPGASAQEMIERLTRME